MNVSRKYTAIPPACKMLFNYTSEAAVRYRSFTPIAGGGVPPFDYKAPAENIRVVSKNNKEKLTQAKSKSEVSNIKTILSYHEVKKAVLKINKAVPLSKAAIKAVYQQCLQEVNKQYPEVIQTLQKIQIDFHRGYRKNEYKKQGNIGVNCAWVNNPSLAKSTYGCY